MQVAFVSDLQMLAVRAGARALILDGRQPPALGNLMLERRTGVPGSWIVPVRRVSHVALCNLRLDEITASGMDAWHEVAAAAASGRPGGTLAPDHEFTVVELG